jgi:uncharacterized protein (DUF2141 family)
LPAVLGLLLLDPLCATAQDPAAAALPAAPAAATRPGTALLPGPLPRGAVPGCTGAADEVRLRVTVKDVRDNRGLMTITLYPDKPSDFLARKGKIARLRIPVAAPATEACIAAPGPGGYAIAVYHDLNADTDFNRNVIGIPEEPFGFSNDAGQSLGLPRFQDVRFHAEVGDTPVSVTLRYY